jgi:hypothetical protein
MVTWMVWMGWSYCFRLFVFSARGVSDGWMAWGRMVVFFWTVWKGMVVLVVQYWKGMALLVEWYVSIGRGWFLGWTNERK